MRLIRPFPPSAPTSFAGTGVLAGMRGSLAALVTPFRHRTLDTAALASLCDRQVRRGTAALVVCGSTGEAPALLPSEVMRAVHVAAEAAAGRVPVIAGCWAPATDAAVALAGAAARSGADALLVAPPAYSRPTQAGIIAHVRAVAHAASRPVLLYDMPGRTGVAVSDEAVARLFERGLIEGFKDAAGDLARPVRLRALCGAGLLQFSGDDATAAAHLAMGGDGCISVTANLAPALCAGLQAAWRGGDLAGFAQLRDLLAPLHAALFGESNPIPVKAALCLAGLCSGEVRLPLTRAGQATLDLLAPLLPGLLAAEDEAAGQPRLSLVS